MLEGSGGQPDGIPLGHCWRRGFSFILIFNKVFLFGFFSFLSVTLSTGLYARLGQRELCGAGGSWESWRGGMELVGDDAPFGAASLCDALGFRSARR